MCPLDPKRPNTILGVLEMRCSSRVNTSCWGRTSHGKENITFSSVARREVAFEDNEC